MVLHATARRARNIAAAIGIVLDETAVFLQFGQRLVELRLENRHRALTFIAGRHGLSLRFDMLLNTLTERVQVAGLLNQH